MIQRCAAYHKTTFYEMLTTLIIFIAEYTRVQLPVDDSAKCRQVETMRASKIGGFLASK